MIAPSTVAGQGSAGAEGGRRPTGAPAERAISQDPEVLARPSRRRLTIAYKLKVLDVVSSLRGQGQGAIGAYLRKEGLYYSSVRKWDLLHAQGVLTGRQSGSREKGRDALLAENKQLRRKLEQTEKRLRKAELLVELQKKLSAMMDLDEPTSSERSAEA